MSKLLSNLFLVLFSVLVACGQPQAIDSGLPDATVLRFDVRTSSWDPAPLSAVALGEEWRDGDDVFVRTSDGDALVGQISAQELAKADQTWSGLATSPASNGWVRTYGDAVRHVRLTEMKPGDRFVYGGRIFETRGGSAVEAIRATGEVIERVVGTHRRVAPGVFDAVVEHADGTRETLTATPEHPFYVPALGDYVELGDLEVGTVLLEAGGGEARLVSKAWREEMTEVFNFEVERTHNYFVRGPGGSTGILVHNSCRGRIQAQGKNLEVSRSWSQADPPTVAEGKAMLAEVQGELTKRQAKDRTEAFKKAEAFIDSAGDAGGASAPVSKTFKVKNTKSERVVIEVIKGKAFVPE